MKKSIWFVTVSLAFSVGCTDLGVVHEESDPGSDFLPPTGRVSDGVQVLYTFAEGAGDRIGDVSAEGVPVDLFIGDLGAVAWLPGGGIDITQPTLITTAQKPNDLMSACRLSNAITIEMWHQPASVTADNARMFTLSEDDNLRNFSLIQGAVRYEVRVRTTGTDDNGSPALQTEDGTVSGQIQHVVFTRDPISSKLYLDGAVVGEGVVGGDFTNWDLGYQLAIGNELTEERPYRGSVFLAAVYCRVLSPAEVRVNFQAGY